MSTTPRDVPAASEPAGVRPNGGAREYYSVSEAAALLGVSRTSIWRWIRDGRLSAARLGHRTTRIARADLDRALVHLGPAGAHARGGGRPGAWTTVAAGAVVEQVGVAEHAVQFYETDVVLLDTVAAFIGAALQAGDAGIVVATPAHRAGLEDRLRASGLDVAAARADGRYVALDAAQTLAQFMVDGAPDAGRFAEVVGGIVARTAARARRVHVFGEMVALLAVEGDRAAALRLEALWNELQATHAFSLLCAYPIERLGAEPLTDLVGDVCAAHTRTIPAESYTALRTAEDQLRAITVLQQKARRLEAEVDERRRAEARYRDLVHTLDAIVWEADARTFRFTFVSPQAERLLGYPVAQWLAEPHFWADHIHPDDRGWAMEYCLMCTAAKEDHDFEYRVLAADGRVVWLRDLVRVVAGDDGQPATLRGVMIDITAQKQTEAALRESERRYHDLFEHANDIHFTLDLDGNITDINRYGEQVTGYTRAELLGTPVARLVAPAYQERMREVLDQKSAGEAVTTYELELDTKNGGRLTVEVRSRLVTDPAGRPVGIQGSAHEITERWQAEEVRQRLAAIVESSEDAIIGKTLDAVITSWNAGAERMYGYSAAEAVGRPIAMLVPPDRPNELPPIMARLRRGERIAHYETERVRKDGTRLAVALSISPIHDAAGAVVGASAIARDITDRKQAEAERARLYAAEQRARREAEISAARVRRLGAITAAFSEATTIEQVAEVMVTQGAEAVGAGGGAVRLLSDDGAELEAVATANVAAGTAAAWHRFPVSLAAPAADAARAREPLFFEDRAAMIAAYPHLADELRAAEYEAGVQLPLLSEGRVMGTLGLYFAARRRFSPEDREEMGTLARQCAQALERARLYQAEQRARADAQAALRVRDEFLGSVSHDLRTPLSAIKGLTQVVLRRASRGPTLDSARVAAALTTVEASADRMAAMIDELLDLTRLDAGRPLDLNRELTDLVALVGKLVAEYQRTTRDHRLLVVAEQPALIGAWDPARLERVIANLLSNAIKYSPAGGAITVAVAADDAAGRPWARLTVADEGLGIPAADLPSIFERFHRGANVAGAIRGVGIGLSGSKQIVEQHGGSISVASVEGAGTTVTVRLPCDAADSAAPGEDSEA